MYITVAGGGRVVAGGPGPFVDAATCEGLPTLGAMTLVIAHRGASADHPENTLDAFEAALAQGADWVEFDVRRTADDEVVVHHDATLADGTVIVDCAASDLPESIPTLAAVLDACGPMGVNIEIKSDPNESDYDDEYPVVGLVLDAIRARLTKDRALISSFDMGAINAVHDHRSNIPTAFLTADAVGPEVAVGRAVAHNHLAVNPAEGLVTARFVTAAHDAGLAVYPWTVDDPDRMRELVDFGVDGIITNTPAVLRALL